MQCCVLHVACYNVGQVLLILCVREEDHCAHAQGPAGALHEVWPNHSAQHCCNTQRARSNTQRARFNTQCARCNIGCIRKAPEYDVSPFILSPRL
jgi:hypothetical protein